jgi:exopolysaccharide biosynthesis polyprenyl glycosylphosphotransferase
MSNIRRRILLNAFKLFDMVLMVAAFVAAAELLVRESHSVTFAEFMAMRVSVGNFLIFTGLLVMWHLLFSGFGLYASRRLSRRSAEVADTLKAIFIATLLLGVGSVIFRIKMATPTFLLTFWGLSSLLMVASRLGLRWLLAQTRMHGRNLRDILIVGTNTRSVGFAKSLQSRPELGYRIIGFVDQEWEGSEEFRNSGYPLVSNLDELPNFLRKNVVDEVLIALPIRSFHDNSSKIAELCEEQGIMFRVLPNLFDLKRSRFWTEEVEGQPLVTHHNGISEGWQLIFKRMLDFTVALTALMLLSPVLVGTALLIALTTPGPVFFIQRRVGLHKREFPVYKFRTMVANAEQKLRDLEHLNEVSGPVFKITKDPRITPVGRFLRKTSIDELPQLINVLKGDMSLVGPRPLPVRDYEGFSKDWQRRRFSVRPGITCLWQVSGRSSIPFEQWMELDLQYIDKWSLWLDLRILVRTIPAVLKGEGAA